MIIRKDTSNADRFAIMKASKALTKRDVKNNSQINISLDLIEIERNWIEICAMKR